MRNFIVTNKDIIIRKVSETGMPEHLVVNYRGTRVLGANQLADYLYYEAEQRIKEKYLAQEIKLIFNEIKLIKLNPKELKKFFKFIEFVNKTN